MSESYDLTEDNRELRVARQVNVDLVIVRNAAYVQRKTRNNVSAIQAANRLYTLAQSIIGPVSFYIDSESWFVYDIISE